MEDESGEQIPWTLNKELDEICDLDKQEINQLHTLLSPKSFRRLIENPEEESITSGEDDASSHDSDS